MGSWLPEVKLSTPATLTVAVRGAPDSTTLVGSRGPPPNETSFASRSRTRVWPTTTVPESALAMGGRAVTWTVTVAAFETLPEASATVYWKATGPVAARGPGAKVSTPLAFTLASTGAPSRVTLAGSIGPPP